MFSAELYHVGRKEREKKTTDPLKIFYLHERRNDKVHALGPSFEDVFIRLTGLKRPKGVQSHDID